MMPRLTDISAVVSLAQLRDIQISICKKLTDISPVASCSKLRTLKIEACPCNVDTVVAACSNLRVLTVDGERRVLIAPPSNSTSLVLPPSGPPPPSPPTSPPGSESVDGGVAPPPLTLDQPAAQATMCALLKVDCAVCTRRALTYHESLTHVMQWPDDLLTRVWDGFREMLRPRLKARLWAQVHAELIKEWQEVICWPLAEELGCLYGVRLPQMDPPRVSPHDLFQAEVLLMHAFGLYREITRSLGDRKVVCDVTERDHFYDILRDDEMFGEFPGWDPVWPMDQAWQQFTADRRAVGKCAFD